MRESVQQSPPDPDLPWQQFPRSLIKAGHALYRAARRGNSAWWFCNKRDCRFDLSAPRGTCYFGTDQLACVLECIGPDLVAGDRPLLLVPKFIEEREIHEFMVPETIGVATLASSKAIGFKITNELESMTPYAVPQQYAARFDTISGKRAAHRFRGIRFRTRFDTRQHAHGIALFGERTQEPWPSEVHDIDDALIARLGDFGVFVEDPPGVVRH